LKEAAGAAAGYGAGIRIVEERVGSRGRRRASDDDSGSAGGACAVGALDQQIQTHYSRAVGHHVDEGADSDGAAGS
jgi:hypothetical protein